MKSGESVQRLTGQIRADDATVRKQLEQSCVDSGFVALGKAGQDRVHRFLGVQESHHLLLKQGVPVPSIADQIRNNFRPVGNRDGPGEQVGTIDVPHEKTMKMRGDIRAVGSNRRARKALDYPELAFRGAAQLHPKINYRAARSIDIGRSLTKAQDGWVGFDDQPGSVRVIAAQAQAPRDLRTEDFNAPTPGRPDKWHSVFVNPGHGHNLA